MTGDLISRKALVKALIAERDKHPPEMEERYSFGVKLPHRYNQAIRGGIRKALREIEMAPSVDAVLVVHGRWIPAELHKSFGVLRGVKCSVCGEEKVGKGCNYCPNCGARMDGDADALD